MVSSSPKISVLLTSFNQAEFLAQSINSILQQTYTDFELVIIDDCSSDNSWEIIKSFKDERIQALRMEQNTYCSYFFDAIENATGEYIAIAHSDDAWKTDKLEKQISYLISNENVAACFTFAKIINEQGEEVLKDSIFSKAFNRNNRTRFEWLHEFYYNGGGLCHPSVMLKKSIFEEGTIKALGLSSVPDYCEWIRICMRYEIYVYPEKLSLFRIRENGQNSSGDRASIHYRNTTELYFVLDEYLKIDKPSEFIKVFPKTEKYFINGAMIIPFAFAQMILHEETRPLYVLFALKLLYSVMKNEATAKLAKEMYGYTVRDYALEKLKWDVFSVIPQNKFLNSRLYVDIGDGYKDEISLTQEKVYVNNENRFSVSFNLDELCNGKEILSLRFDPDDANFRAFFNMQFYADGKTVTAVSKGAYLKDNKDIFNTLDSQYIITVPKKVGTIKICGSTSVLSFSQVDLMLQNEINDLFSLRLDYSLLKDNLSKTNLELSAVNSNLNSSLNIMNEELSKIKIEQEQSENRLSELSEYNTHLDNYLQKHRIKAIIKLVLNRKLI